MLVFTYGVTYPLPRSHILGRLCSMLLRALSKPSCTNGQSIKFRFWAAMIGALGHGLSEGAGVGFMAHLRTFASALRIVKWDDAHEILHRFLWLDSACNSGASHVMAAIGLTG